MKKKPENIFNLTVEEVSDITHYPVPDKYWVSLLYHYSRNYPIHENLTINKDTVPAFLHPPLERLIELSNYVNRYNPEIVYANYIFNSYLFFSKLDRIELKDLDMMVKLYTATAFICIFAEKQNDIPYWQRPLIRPKDPAIDQTIKHFRKTGNFFLLLEDLIDDNRNPGAILLSLVALLETVNLMFEYKIEKGILIDALRNLEDTFQKCDILFGLSQRKDNSDLLRQDRFSDLKNRLYRDGGRILEMTGNPDMAFEWYTNQVLNIKIFDEFSNHLDGIATCERLLYAYNLSMNTGRETTLLKQLLDNSVVRMYRLTSEYARKILDFISKNPDLDLTSSVFSINNHFVDYSGRSVREVYLFSLLYGFFTNDKDFRNIDYQSFFMDKMKVKFL